MMTSIKYAIAFMFGGLYFSCLGVLVAYKEFILQNPVAFSALTTAFFLMSFFIVVFIARFFVVYWRKR